MQIITVVIPVKKQTKNQYAFFNKNCEKAHMLNIDFKTMVSPDGTLKFSSFKKNAKGFYTVGKLIEPAVWVNLTIAKNDEQLLFLQEVIETCISNCLNNKLENSISIPHVIFKTIIEGNPTVQDLQGLLYLISCV